MIGNDLEGVHARVLDQPAEPRIICLNPLFHLAKYCLHILPDVCTLIIIFTLFQYHLHILADFCDFMSSICRNN